MINEEQSNKYIIMNKQYDKWVFREEKNFRKT